MKGKKTRDTCFVGSKVWVKVPEETRVFELGEVLHISADNMYTVEIQSGEQMVVSAESLKVTHENGCKSVVEDLLDLSDYSEESLLFSLRERYGDDLFYSMVGPILISINPYKWCDIYSSTSMEEFRGKRNTKIKPHVFSIAEAAYRAIVEDPDHLSQAIIISGESGAGKTEATKIIMKYLSTAGRQQRHDHPEADSSNSHTDPSKRGLEQRVLDANPLLEAFGNAKTVRNDNSSRFGKFIEIQIDQTGLITGAKVINYLLEKSRIIRQAEGERNYHIFYQLLRGADKDKLEDLGLGGIIEHDFEYICTGSCLSLFEENDVSNFQRTLECLDSIGVPESEQRSLFLTLAGVLHLGNIKFDERHDVEGSIAQEEFVNKAASVLGLPTEELRNALCYHLVQVGGESIRKPILPLVAKDKRDALAKALYALLFRWLVLRINSSLAGHAANLSQPKGLRRTGSTTSLPISDSGHFIGILDIYGFEVFEENSFEQFCINFANEKLQRHFNKYIFEVEQIEYEKEGIDWSRIEFNDNQPCLNLIDTSRNSVLCLLDEECIMPKGSDSSFLRKLHNNHKDRSQHYVSSRFGGESVFGIKHYAGVVEYTVDGFISKNNDSLSEELCGLMQRSKNEWITALFPNVSTGNQKTKKRGSSLRGPTVSQQFRKQLESLTQKLESCKPNFIRCIKPNEFKIPGFFDTQKCLNQLRYAGMMETVRIRDAGYALRERHDSFYRRFKILAPDAKNCGELVKQIAQQFDLHDMSLWQIGVSKVFLKRSLSELLDRCAGVRLTAAARTISKSIKGTILRKKKGAVAVIESFYDRVRFVIVLRKVLKIQCTIRMRLARFRAEKRKQLLKDRPKPQSDAYTIDVEKLLSAGKTKETQSKKAAPDPMAQFRSIRAANKAKQPKEEKPILPTSDIPKDSAEVISLREELESSKLKAAQREVEISNLKSNLEEESEQRKLLEEQIANLKRQLEEKERSESNAKLRISDFEEFIDGLHSEEEKVETRYEYKTLDSAVDSLLRCVKKSIRRMEMRVQEASREAVAQKPLHSIPSSEDLKALFMQQSEMMMKTLEAQRSAKQDDDTKVNQLENIVQSQRNELERLKMELARAENVVERLKSELQHEQSDNQLRILALEREIERGLAERQRVEIDLEESLEAQKRLELETKQNSASVDTSVSNLMRENVALLDEVLDTRSKHQALYRKTQKLESRARQAEAANETLVTLLSWRDNQLSMLVDEKESLGKAFKNQQDYKTMESCIGDLKVYFDQITSSTESKLDDYE